MYQKILVPLDGSELAECVLPHLETIARGCEIATVVFVLVVDPTLPPARSPNSSEFGLRKIDREQLEKHRKSVAEDYLQQLTKKLNYNWTQVQTKVLVGKVAESIAEYAEKNSIDIILIYVVLYSFPLTFRFPSINFHLWQTPEQYGITR
jgi:nucleotide-binding universal stress UspA family protein